MAVNRIDRYWEEQGSTETATPKPRFGSGEPRPAASGWAESLGQRLANHPQATVVAAISLGVLLGWLTKRR